MYLHLQACPVPALWAFWMLNRAVKVVAQRQGFLAELFLPLALHFVHTGADFEGFPSQ